MTNDKVNPQMDWQQVILNGGPSCFALAGDLDTHYCGRAQRWAGHDSHHKFVSLDDLVATVRAEERKQAFGDAQGMMEAPAPGTMASTDFHKGFEAMRRLAKQILERAVLQAAATENRKGEG